MGDKYPVPLPSQKKKSINYSKGLDENIDVKKMKGKWKGYHRIRVGRIRMILKVDFKERIREVRGKSRQERM